jgi:excisionase family DNA binding protein
MTETDTERRLFDIQAAVLYLRSIGAAGVGTHFVRSLISSGQLPHIRMGKRFYVSRGALDSWLEKNEKRSR